MEYSKIILCGRRCSGKTTLFWDLQKVLGWPIFSISLYLRDYLHRHNLKTIDDIDKASYDISQDIDERMHSLLLTPDRIIFDARMYGYIQNAYPSTLKVLLLTDERTRIKRAAYREGTSEEVQFGRLIKKENGWIEKMKTLYPFDFFDPKHYDIVIDTTNLKPEEVLDTMMRKLNSHV